MKRSYWRKLNRFPHHRWDMLKNLLEALIRYQRIETTLSKAKELQQYAEEIVFLAKKDTPESDLKVESMLRTPAARRILYEVLLPRYAERQFFFTRIVNQFRFRYRDSTPMAFIEYVDRPGELRPADPVGWDRKRFVWDKMTNGTRRDRRKYEAEARRKGLYDIYDNFCPDINLIPRDDAYEWHSDEDAHYDEPPEEAEAAAPPPSDPPEGEAEVEGADVAPGHDKEGKQIVVSKGPRLGPGKGKVELPGPHRALQPFFVDIPPPSHREMQENVNRLPHRPV
ncbi:unnamed protein product [Vitrella brassicaformis CCMP3155]|uniref:Ribosomal protein L17 n=2 Tax=Vitrella brassicaformis TaxID=1169539 RepID=A0A0G4FHB6_VITBC|nr:unnamed protein product [Vitrella brassicaformis CCMP3155]|eukprot:CEM12687.1 unnamed protein product [Vitrella brassicaformis CCMP3155]